ncbi:MAG: SRPBCC family protein [Mobilicoccus sp.]|nr:SRPBCC family protein [Mobilicoccus sp.]
MPSGTEESLYIDAPPAEVLDVVADVELYPEWSGDMTSATVLTEDEGWPQQVEFTVDAGVIKDTYVLDYTWDVDEDGVGEVTWQLVRSAKLRGLDGAYVLTPEGEGTRVTYRLTVDLAVPLPGVVRRKAEKTIVTTALSGLRRRVESAA